MNSHGVACVLVKPHGSVHVLDIIVRHAERYKGYGSAIFAHAVQALLANHAITAIQLNVVNRPAMTKLVTAHVRRPRANCPCFILIARR
jgi:hypothetical protein